MPSSLSPLSSLPSFFFFFQRLFISYFILIFRDSETALAVLEFTIDKVPEPQTKGKIAKPLSGDWVQVFTVCAHSVHRGCLLSDVYSLNTSVIALILTEMCQQYFSPFSKS